MSKKASKSLIGAFVLGAIALVIAGVVIFGSGRFFKKTYRYVLFFEGSVKGLNVGAPVIFRGVKVGRVTDIRLRLNLKDLTVIIPVYIELDPGTAAVVGGNLERGHYLKGMIEKGLRAQLQMQSFVTGLLVINLDFYPDKPVRLVGLEKRYPEIPTIPTPLEELTKTIQDLKLDQTVRKLESAIEGIDRIVNSPELKQSIVSLNQMLRSINTLAVDIDSRIVPVASSVKETSEAARKAFVQAEKTLAMKEGAPGEIARSVTDTLTSARVTLEETQRAIEGVRRVADRNVNLGYDLSRTLEEISSLSRSLRSLTDYLDLHPEALIKGKKTSGGD
ncbi:MAG: MlaD family protein [Nitrospirae bacterium]|nr:MlaD family protein [Nitrospirota bacterium]